MPTQMPVPKALTVEETKALLKWAALTKYPYGHPLWALKEAHQAAVLPAREWGPKLVALLMEHGLSPGGDPAQALAEILKKV